ncbi:hypothetical protein DENIS_3733 [Desulfonema ishimotonii]|uniref:Solute-binding protein family 3/N-terminal domain-containing protein n=2 Tax=Desulfonema ishimotonii TaxID=45657 RepID=A0A401G0N7_9BACT|nr:hypothetical protein DENIS_3733 [Desulfonema ishimotonii]
MKKRIISILITGMLCVFFSLDSFGNETVYLTTGEWSPFTSEDLKDYGFLCRVTTEAFGVVGVNTKYKFFPWKRASFLVENGVSDGSVGWIHSEKREDKYYLSDPLAESYNVFFHLKNYKFDWKTEEDLKGIRIGVTIGYYEEEWLKQMQIESNWSDLLNLKKLARGRIDIFPCNQEVCMFLIRKNFPPEMAKQITYHRKPYYRATSHVIFSKTTEKGLRLRNLLNEGLKRLHESGRYKQLADAFAKGEYD